MMLSARGVACFEPPFSLELCACALLQQGGVMHRRAVLAAEHMLVFFECGSVAAAVLSNTTSLTATITTTH